VRIQVEGAGEHNLRDIDVQFDEGLTAVTGVSGSGKTSLVFDTLYHEARRRFLEVFALGSTALRLAPARVRSISGLGPAVAVGQNRLNRNPNSTLASASGLHLFLRMLYAGFGERYCPHCGTSLTVYTEDEIVERLLSMAYHQELRLLAPLLRGVRGSHRTLLNLLAGQFGPEALWVDGQCGATRELDASEGHDVEVELARLGLDATAAQVRNAVQTAAALGTHSIAVRWNGGSLALSHAPVCTECGAWFGVLRPVHFNKHCPYCAGAGCDRCHGTGLHPEAAAVRLFGLSLPELLALSVEEVRTLFAEGDLPHPAARLRVEIERRLEALDKVGLGYIALDRASPSLSRGEAQRVRLALTLTSRLEDMVHVLDEPTIGQHTADVIRLMPRLRELAGPVIYVEHDRLAASVADEVIDLGPGAGRDGGQLVFQGAPARLWQADTLTGRYFSMRERVAAPPRRSAPEQFRTVHGADLRNLRGIDVPMPVGRLTVIAGVSGSGKSTLVEDVLVATLREQQPVGCREIAGPSLKPVIVDQGPIGRNPRSNPATYTKLSGVIRDLFAAMSSLTPSHFSFNRLEGACPACKGMGAIEVSMRYLPSTWIPCAACEGKRFSDEVLSVKVLFDGQSLTIADFYDLDVREALSLLRSERRLPERSTKRAARILTALRDVGLGYLTLGQPSPTLSGGEAQRVKLAKSLGRGGLSHRLLVLDEPTTGLHPRDVAALLLVLDRLVRRGATIVVVEHHTDVIRAADWVIELGPGAGPKGGRLLYAGDPDGLAQQPTPSGQALRDEAAIQPRVSAQAVPPERSPSIAIRGARVHNLKSLDVDIPKRALTVVTGVSGSGKSSLVKDVLEAEARRRFLETLTLYERQATREGAEALVESVSGLGVGIAVGTERRLRYDLRATVGTATELSRHLAVLLSLMGERRCLECGAHMDRLPAERQTDAPQAVGRWRCASCGAEDSVARPRHFSPQTYAAACLTCHGIGYLQKPCPQKLIIHPEKPLCAGAMYSPGFFPNGYLCKPLNFGCDMTRALGERYGFDPEITPWNHMTPDAQQAFLFGDAQPLEVTFRSRSRTGEKVVRYPGFYGWVRDWDVGGMYTESYPCPSCGGQRLRPEYLAVRINGHNVFELSEMSLTDLLQVLDDVVLPDGPLASTAGSLSAAASLDTARQRLRFLLQVGLGYLHLNRRAASLSAGEAQRIRLAHLLGSGLTSLTVLMDEPSRGMHPSELEALLRALKQLRDEGNTVIVVEHDPLLIRAADHLIDMGPGPGVHGGQIVAQGTPEEVARRETVTAAWLRGERRLDGQDRRRSPNRWLEIRGARANNLCGGTVRFPLHLLVGVCGVSGSGKSTLCVDTLGRALSPKKVTTSVAYEPLEPGPYDAIEGEPKRTIVVDQSLAGITSPVDYLKLARPLRRLFADSDDAKALGLEEQHLKRRCSACNGQGLIRLDMGFLPSVRVMCETCQGTGFLPEAWDVCLRGWSLPELSRLTIDQVYELFGDLKALVRPLEAAREVGLGYLVLRQPRHALSGGEAQRLKIAAELCRKTSSSTLYIMDEPTVGQHLEDVARLVSVLHRLVNEGHTVLVLEHHSHLLASCDWLVELGPGGGPQGGRVIAAGTPEQVAAGATPTASYLREVLEVAG
jgi:excinuclease ABC subunit A